MQKSIDHEQSGNLKRALDYRVRALDEYLAIIKGKCEDCRDEFLMTLRDGFQSILMKSDGEC